MSFIVCTMCWKSQNQLSATINCLRAISTVFQRKKTKRYIYVTHTGKRVRVLQGLVVCLKMSSLTLSMPAILKKKKNLLSARQLQYMCIYTCLCVCVCVFMQHCEKYELLRFSNCTNISHFFRGGWKWKKVYCYIDFSQLWNASLCNM